MLLLQGCVGVATMGYMAVGYGGAAYCAYKPECKAAVKAYMKIKGEKNEDSAGVHSDDGGGGRP